MILPSICRINHVYNPHPPSSSYSHSSDTITHHLINPSHPWNLSPNKGLPHPNITSTSVTIATHSQDMYIFPTAMLAAVQPWLLRTFSCYAFFVHNPRNVLCVNSKPSHKERTLCARSLATAALWSFFFIPDSCEDKKIYKRRLAGKLHNNMTLLLFGEALLCVFRPPLRKTNKAGKEPA